MLYERWSEIARQNRHETALIDARSGKRWSFQALADASLTECDRSAGPVFAEGISAEFVLTVLRAWRAGRVVCPLESGQQPVPLSNFPAGCVHLKTTSASTGLPRLIAFSADQLMADVDQIVATMGLRPDWPNLGVISLAHSYGFSNLVLPLLLHGIPLVLVPGALPETLRRAAEEVHAATLPAVPALWRAWHDARAIPGNITLAISA